jgi:hypothetical protein
MISSFSPYGHIFVRRILKTILYAVGNRSQSSVIGIGTTLLGGPSGVQILAGLRDFSVLQNIQTGSGTHAASYSMGTGLHFQG